MGWIEYHVQEEHTTAIVISLVEDGQVQPLGGGIAVKQLSQSGVKFIGDI